jgi:hypothetical protein
MYDITAQTAGCYVQVTVLVEPTAGYRSVTILPRSVYIADFLIWLT